MKITFFSNFINHHEIPFCDALYKLIGSDFTFVQTIPVDKERLKMGWGGDFDNLIYLKLSYQNNSVYNECIKLGAESDVVILGSAPYKFIADRVKNNKLTFYYAERLFRKSFLRALYPPSFIKIFNRFIYPGWKSNFYMLCASGYTCYDVSRIFTFKNKCYNWGHFPEFLEYNNIDTLISNKESETIEILWVGRFLGLKHPEYALQVAKRLKDEGVNFKLKMIGSGEKESEMLNFINTNHLEELVELPGNMDPVSVRRYMERANIFLFTSDFNEGWGAVLYEAMNSGCAVIASHSIGAVPLMLEHCNNGLIYLNENIDDLYKKVKELVFDKKQREIYGKNAYSSLKTLWNAEIGATRFYEFSYSIIKGNKLPFYTEGPLSLAIKFKNNWFKK